jgi:hypothetical protein
VKPLAALMRDLGLGDDPGRPPIGYIVRNSQVTPSIDGAEFASLFGESEVLRCRQLPCPVPSQCWRPARSNRNPNVRLKEDS